MSLVGQLVYYSMLIVCLYMGVVYVIYHDSGVRTSILPGEKQSGKLLDYLSEHIVAFLNILYPLYPYILRFIEGSYDLVTQLHVYVTKLHTFAGILILSYNFRKYMSQYGYK